MAQIPYRYNTVLFDPARKTAQRIAPLLRLGSYHVSSGSSEERVFLGHVEAVCGQYEQGQRWNAGLCIFQQRCVAFCVPGLRAFLFDGLRFLLYPCDLFHLCIPYSRVDDRKSQQPQNPLQVRIFSCEHHARMYHCYP